MIKVFESKIIVPVVLVLIVSVVAYAGWQFTKESGGARVPFVKTSIESEEEAEALALRTARRHSGVDFTPEYADVSNFISHSYFDRYYFVYVQSALGHSETALFAIGRDGGAWKLPEEFNGLAQDAKLTPTTREEARDLLEWYIALHIGQIDGQNQILLADAADIPGVEGEVVERYRSLVVPMAISDRDGGWTFEFFTWQIIGGVLTHWRVDMDPSGEVHVRQQEQLETRVGNYGMME